jgi:2-methylcitrate dehydratase PrpD
MTTTLDALAAFACDLTLADAPAGVVARARLQHLSLAGALRGFRGDTHAAPLRKAGAPRGAARCVTGGTAPARDAVRLHAGLAGLFALDDLLLTGLAPTAGVAAAWAGARRHTVGEVLRATIAANEVAGRLGASLLLGGRGGEAQAAVSALAAATASGVLAGLDADALARAMALALVPLPAPTAGELRAVGAARAAAASGPAVLGVEAVDLAAAGQDAPRDLLDGDSFFAGRTPLPLRAAFTGLGAAWLTSTLACKLLPVSTFVQTPVQAVDEILRRHVKAAGKRLRVDQVESIEVAVAAPAAGFEALAAGLALDAAAVPYRTPYAVAALVAAHELGPDQLDDRWLAAHAEALQGLAARVTVRPDWGRTVRAVSHMLTALAPLFAGVPPRRLLSQLYGALPADALAGTPDDPVAALTGAAKAAWAARPERALQAVRRAEPDLSTARLDEWQLRTDTEVRLHTTRGGTWPERRTVPEGAPGWSWDDTVSRVLARHGEGAAALHAADASTDAEGWVSALLD